MPRYKGEGKKVKEEGKKLWRGEDKGTDGNYFINLNVY